MLTSAVLMLVVAVELLFAGFGSGVALEIFCVHRAAQRAPRRRTCLAGREAAAPEFVFEEREMRRDLAREIGLGPSRAQRVEESQYKASSFHGRFCGV